MFFFPFFYPEMEHMQFTECRMNRSSHLIKNFGRGNVLHRNNLLTDSALGAELHSRWFPFVFVLSGWHFCHLGYGRWCAFMVPRGCYPEGSSWGVGAKAFFFCFGFDCAIFLCFYFSRLFSMFAFMLPCLHSCFPCWCVCFFAISESPVLLLPASSQYLATCCFVDAT